MRVRFSLPAPAFLVYLLIQLIPNTVPVLKKTENSAPKGKIKVLVVLGPTASGKSELAVKLARTFKGEVISADSRQVYTGLDIGSGKITQAEMKGVPHHLLDVVSPKKTFTVVEYQVLGEQAIADIAARGKLPIVCGGSAFYIQALIDSVEFPEVLPNKKLRSMLEKKTVAALCNILQKKDPRRFAEIDQANSRRLIRAIEIADALGKVPIMKARPNGYDPFFIGIKPEDAELKARIKKRILKRLIKRTETSGGQKDMIAEVIGLHKGNKNGKNGKKDKNGKKSKNGLSWKRLEKFGLEYRSVARFLQKKITRLEMITELETTIWQFSKRQMTWFKRDQRIRWFKTGDFSMIKKVTEKFLV